MYNIIDIAAGALIVIVIVVVVLLRNRSTPRSLDRKYFQARWVRLQKLCSDKKNWYMAVVDADDLLDEALKQRHFKGKTTGERLVSAQHQFSSNDALWLSHKLRNKIKDDDLQKLNKKETLSALSAYKTALMDLGALGPNRKTKARS